MPARHPKIRQRKQRHHLSRIFCQPTEPHLGVTELPLDHSKRVLNFRSRLRLDLLDLADDFVQKTTLAVFLIGASARSDLPDDLASLMLFSLFDTGVASIGADHVFL